MTTGQIIVFGLTGGLIPCPAAITVLLLCLQLKQVALGATLVLCFSIGLAVTMVSVGVVAALGMRHAEKRFSGAFSAFARKAPYASGALIIIVGLIMAVTSGHPALSSVRAGRHTPCPPFPQDIQMTASSPCLDICKFERRSDMRVGCFRTTEEIRQ